MLYTLSGTPGAGKSYNTVKNIIKYLKKGHYVITNIPLSYSEIAKFTHKTTSEVMQLLYILDNEEITPRFLFTFYNLNSKKVTTELIIDEAADLFNSRSWNDKERPDWLRIFRMHRHMYFNVCLISQSRKDLDSQIQRLFDVDFNYIKPTECGVIGLILWLFSKPFGELRACRELYIPTRGTSSFKFFMLSKRYFKSYDSYTMNNYRNDFMVDDYASDTAEIEHLSAHQRTVVIPLPGFDRDKFLEYKQHFINRVG